MGSGISKFGWALLTKATVVTAVLLTYAYHSDLKKVDYTVFEKKTPVAGSFFQNPPILNVKWNSNDEGTLETYLVNEESGKKVEILYDMFPSNAAMVEAMRQRALLGYDEPGFNIKSLNDISRQYSLNREKPANLFERVLECFQGDKK